MAKKLSKKTKPQWKRSLGYSPAQVTASGAGVHERKGRHRRRDERRKNKQRLKRGELD